MKHNLSERVKCWSAASILAGLLAPSHSLAAPPPGATPPPSVPSTTRSVTLITGDRVLLSGSGTDVVGILRAPGREAVRIVTQRVPMAAQGSHLYVIPEDAGGLIAAGKVDRRLFDVTLLLEFGYDDAHRRDLPFIVTYERQGGQVATVSRAVAGAAVERVLPSINGQAMAAPKAEVAQVWRSVVSGRAGAGAARATFGDIRGIWLDGLLRPVLDQSVAQIGAPEAWALGYEGDGVVVGVLDTGVDDTHPDLADRVIVSRNFTETVDADTIGHGTHVASIIAGSGAASDGRYRGVAPGAQLLAAKVCEDIFCPESSIIAGAQWAVAEEGARVVNMSLGGGDAPGYDPLEEAVSTLTAQYGALFVVAAGNSGPLPGTIESPGSVAAALTVGAVDRDEQLAFFSSRGMTPDGALKPDLTAPGVDIVAARGAGTELGQLIGDDYVAASGTSMATPHVAGAAALLVQRHPVWNAADLKGALVGTAVYNPEFTALDQGTGRVDIPVALEADLLASTPSLGFGVAGWPHDDDEPMTRTVAYRNLGDAVELAFELDVSGPDGAPAADGMFVVEPTSLVVPAGGSASVKVVAKPAAGDVDGLFAGRLIASDGVNRTLAVSVALAREAESYDVALRHIDRDGAPGYGFGLLYSDDPLFFEFVGATPETPEVTYRLPRGDYSYAPLVNSASLDVPASLLVAPLLPITEDTVIEFDARTALPVSLTLPVAGTELSSTMLNFSAATPTTGTALGISFGGGSPVYYSGLVGEHASEAALTAELQGVWTLPDSPDVYTAAWFEEGRLPAGEFVVDTEKLASVHASYARHPDSTITETLLGIAAYRADSGSYGYSGYLVDFPLERTEYYYTTAPDLRWITNMWANNEDFSGNYLLNSPPAVFAPGQSSTRRFNAPIHVIALPELPRFGPFAVRQGDTLGIFAAIYADSDLNEGHVTNEGLSRLYRDGELVGEVASGEGASFDVSPERASYRFELDTSQSFIELSPRQRIVWTFESEHATEGETVLPPLLTIVFDAPLDDFGRAPRGHYCLPLHVAQYGRPQATGLTVASVEASFDDGATWSAAHLEPVDTQWNAHIEHPATGDHVSLRVTAHDTSGNAVEHTVIRAYGLAP